MFNTTAKDIAANDLKNAAGDIKDDVNHAANQAGRKVRSMFNTASDEISHASEKVTGEIRTNPVRSSMIALGVGVLFGALMRR